MGNTIGKISHTLGSIERAITFVVFLIMLALLLIQVFCRYVFNLPLAWADELVRYVYVWVSFFGACIAAEENSHISINILPALLSKIQDENKKQLVIRCFDLFAAVVVTIFFIFISKWLLEYNQSLKLSGQFTTSNQWPMWLMCAPMTVSCIIIAIQYILNALLALFDIAGYSHKKGAAA